MEEWACLISNWAPTIAAGTGGMVARDDEVTDLHDLELCLRQSCRQRRNKQC